jgi:Fe-S-cluster containining protein
VTDDRSLPLLQQLDRWQDEARRRHPEVIPCKPGCAACCHGPFDISVADVAVLVDAVARLPVEVQAEIRDRSRAQVAKMTSLEPSWRSPFDIGDIGEARFDAVCDALAEEPCPLLDATGRCLAYHHRPVVCRIMGLGLVTESGHLIENECPIQAGFPRYHALPPQPFDLESWEEAETEFREKVASDRLGSASTSCFETTIAGALAVGLPMDPSRA